MSISFHIAVIWQCTETNNRFDLIDKIICYAEGPVYVFVYIPFLNYLRRKLFSTFLAEMFFLPSLT